jgi:hypothetical protein
MSVTLTDEQHDWATRFCNLDIKAAGSTAGHYAAPGGPGPNGGPRQGRVVRVEHTGKFRMRPPGQGAYSEREYSDWVDRHPKKKDHWVPLTTDANGQRIVDKAYTPEALWKRRFYYAKMGEDKDSGVVWEVWCNDDGDGEEIDIYVKVPS